MRTSVAHRTLRATLLLSATLPLSGAAWLTCDNVARRPAMKPLVLRPNGCSFSDLSNTHGRAVANLAREGAAHWTTHVLPPNTADPCVITHGDGTWDVALVDPGAIDGLAGATPVMYDGCPNSEIREADIMVAVNLNFNEGDQRHFITGSSAAGAGRGATMHEYGHAVGLQHSDASFGLMRSSLALGMPMGGANSSGSPHYFMADDAFGLLQIGGIPKRLPNFYVSAQGLLNNGSLINADTDPATGATYANPLPVHTRQFLSINVGAGVHEWWSRGVVLRIYADSDSVCSSLPGVGAELGVFAVSLSQFVTASGTIIAKIPALGPSGQVLNVHIAGNLIPAPFQGAETRGWDDCATTGLRILTP